LQRFGFKCFSSNYFFLQEKEYDPNKVVEEVVDLIQKIKTKFIKEWRVFFVLSYQPEIQNMTDYCVEFRKVYETVFDVCMLYYLIKGKDNVLRIFLFAFFYLFTFFCTDHYTRLKKHVKFENYQQDAEKLELLIQKTMKQYSDAIQILNNYIADYKRTYPKSKFEIFKELEA
jgi:hypothetical protein